MANSSGNDALHPMSNNAPRRSYLPKRTCQVQVIPTAEALKLVSGTRLRCYRTIVRKPNMLEAQKWNFRAFCSSHGKPVLRTNASSHSLGTNQTGKAHQESIQTPKPPGSEKSKSCLPKSNPKISRNRHGVVVDPDQKAGLGVGKKIGQGKAPAAHKRKVAHEDGPNNAKLTHAAVKG